MFKKLLFPALLLLFSNALYATHIVGGEMRYKCMGPDPITGENEYQVILKVYRDCYNGVPPVDNPAILAVYNGLGQLVQTIEVPPLSLDTLPIVLNNPCLLAPNGLCVEVARYEAYFSLPLAPSGYYFVYQRCCRNGIINNIIDPLSIGATYYVFASAAAQLACNNSPDWTDYPPVTICLGKPVAQLHSATDIENDSIVYSFCAPTNGGDVNNSAPNPPAGPPYFPILFDTGYTAVHPMGGNPLISIDPANGLITGTPNRLGNFVLGVCGKEYRNGVLFSEFSRDFQYIVSSCSQSRIVVSLNNAACDTTVDAIDLNVSNDFPPYQFNWSSGETTEDLAGTSPGLPYTVTVTDGGGCTSVATVNGNDCVWPGDANYDGVANNDDILAIGLLHGDNGPVRPSASTAWMAQEAPYWNATQFNGVNSKHVDCDGSGSIDVFDANAVSINYNQTHPTAYKTVQDLSAPTLSMIFQPWYTVTPGALVTAYITLGNTDLPALGAYGISFSIHCDHPEVLSPFNSATASYDNACVFGGTEHIVKIFKAFPQSGQFDFAVCNTTRKGFGTMYGTVASFEFTLGDNLPPVTAHFSFDNVHLIDDQGNLMPVNVENSFITTGIVDLNSAVKSIRVSPNPATNSAVLYFEEALEGNEINIQVLDLSGRVMMSNSIPNGAGLKSFPIETAGFPKGLYVVQVRDGRAVFTGKIVRE